MAVVAVVGCVVQGEGGPAVAAPHQAHVGVVVMIGVGVGVAAGQLHLPPTHPFLEARPFGQQRPLSFRGQAPGAGRSGTPGEAEIQRLLRLQVTRRRRGRGVRRGRERGLALRVVVMVRPVVPAVHLVTAYHHAFILVGRGWWRKGRQGRRLQLLVLGRRIEMREVGMGVLLLLLLLGVGVAAGLWRGHGDVTFRWC